MYNIKNKGYNNNSGLNYLVCGMGQFTEKPPQVNNPDTARFMNMERERYLQKTMNNGYNEDQSTKMTPEDRSLERNLEIKENPSLGKGDLSISNTEKNARGIQNNVAVTNFKADEMLNKNIRLG
jgi:hypothetical protein